MAERKKLIDQIAEDRTQRQEHSKQLQNDLEERKKLTEKLEKEL